MPGIGNYEGEVLYGSAGSWTVLPTPRFTYQWYRCNPTCAAIPGATASVHVIVYADYFSYLYLSITGTNSFGHQTAVSPNTETIN